MKRRMTGRIVCSDSTLMVGIHRMELGMVVVPMDLERMGTLCLLHHNQAYISDTYCKPTANTYTPYTDIDHIRTLATHDN